MGIERLFGSGFNGITPLNKLERTESADALFNFKTNPVQPSQNKKLSMDTLAGLKQISNGIITPEMADDLLGTPYVSLDFNG